MVWNICDLGKGNGREGSLFPAIGLLAALFICQPQPCHGAFSYDVKLEGVEDGALRGDLEAVSGTIKCKDKPPATVAILNRRAEEDLPLFLKILHSAGYYDGEASFELDREKDPPLITFTITPGPVFLLESIEWTSDNADAAFIKKLPGPEQVGLKQGDPAVASTIIDGEKMLVDAMKREGFPFAEVDQRRVVVDHATKRVQVTFHLEPGSAARFGRTQIKGLRGVDEAFVRGKLPWKEGDLFNADLLTQAQKELTKTNLFGLVRITHGTSVDSDGELPLTMEVKERKHRSIKIGASYKTDEGPGGKFAWENRNVFHGGEKLELGLTASPIALAFNASFLKPAFLHPEQSLLVSSRLANEDTDAYESRSLESGVSLERKFGKTLKLSLGPGFRWSNVTQLGKTEEFALISFPAQMDWDGSDNLLDPTRGARFKVQLSPYWDTLDTNLAFAKTYLGASHYVRLFESPQVVFATRAALGLTGSTTDGPIPADLRFYAGGGGSIRGYPYQSVGPIIHKDHPVGGKSLLELSAEARVKITQNFGLVGFLDGGSAFESSYPDFKEDLLWGAGLGLRYYTPIGPLRLDVGVPLDRRPEIDDPFQIYVSIGQAF
mgnify:CR=1 FL=1